MMRPYCLVLAGALAACGPQMNHPVRDASAYTLSRRCSQGPHDIHVRAIGARWGEEIEVYACSPRDIQGHFDIAVEGASYTAGEYGEQRESIEMEQVFDRMQERRGWYDVDGPDNERCIASEAEIVSHGSSSEGSSHSARSGGPAGPAGGAASTEVETEELDTRPLPPQEGDLLCPVVGVARYDVGSATWEVNDPDDPAPLAAGADIRIRLWSDAPNDLEGATFIVRHRPAQPSVDDASWAQHLRAVREQQEAEWDAQDRQREACERDPACAEQERQRNERAFREEQANDRARNAERRTQPQGPPPAARAETQPPTPSAHADWVPGYWHWSREGASWAWIGGRWRVPEADVAAGLTTHAPSAPPALRAEAPPPAPVEGAVWTDGHWQWAGRWIWVSGSWQLPPNAGARWQAAGWRPSHGAMIFVPGGWLR